MIIIMFVFRYPKNFLDNLSVEDLRGLSSELGEKLRKKKRIEKKEATP